MSGSSGLPDPRLLPANTTLLQPGSRFFRLSDALNYQLLSLASVNGGIQTQLTHLQTSVTANTNSITNLQSQVSTLQSQVSGNTSAITTLNTAVSNLQSQINTINARLAAAGIP